jgi:hypothetical protein
MDEFKQKSTSSITHKNPWIQHVKRYAKEHNVSYMCAISDAKKTYKKTEPKKVAKKNASISPDKIKNIVNILDVAVSHIEKQESYFKQDERSRVLFSLKPLYKLSTAWNDLHYIYKNKYITKKEYENYLKPFNNMKKQIPYHIKLFKEYDPSSHEKYDYENLQYFIKKIKV